MHTPMIMCLTLRSRATRNQLARTIVIKILICSMAQTAYASVGYQKPCGYICVEFPTLHLTTTMQQNIVDPIRIPFPPHPHSFNSQWKSNMQTHTDIHVTRFAKRGLIHVQFQETLFIAI